MSVVMNLVGESSAEARVDCVAGRGQEVWALTVLG